MTVFIRFIYPSNKEIGGEIGMEFAKLHMIWLNCGQHF